MTTPVDVKKRNMRYLQGPPIRFARHICRTCCHKWLVDREAGESDQACEACGARHRLVQPLTAEQYWHESERVS